MTIRLRDYPYPFKAMLAVCSDLDETPNQDVYFETMRFLNTSEQTLLGRGVDLEVGNTIYGAMPEGQFCYESADKVGKDKIHACIQSGHIDCLHSFGDLVNDRDSIEYYWQALQSGERKIEVWIDHAIAASNLDPDIMSGEGAVPNSAAFHTDLSIGSEVIKFVWKGRVTSIIAQNTARNYSGLFNPRNLKTSLKTMAIEFIKAIFAYAGSRKYRMHKFNRVLAQSILVDGTSVTEFMRCNPSWAGVSIFDNARGIHEVLTKKVLDELVQNAGCSVFYTHLGKIHTLEKPFPDKTVRAFELLASYQQRKAIQVTTTRRLLGYCRSRENIEYTVTNTGDSKQIQVTTEYNLEDLAGLTWYYEGSGNIGLFINGERFSKLQFNPADETGFCSVSIPWIPLMYPE